MKEFKIRPRLSWCESNIRHILFKWAYVKQNSFWTLCPVRLEEKVVFFPEESLFHSRDVWVTADVKERLFYNQACWLTSEETICLYIAACTGVSFRYLESLPSFLFVYTVNPILTLSLFLSTCLSSISQLWINHPSLFLPLTLHPGNLWSPGSRCVFQCLEWVTAQETKAEERWGLQECRGGLQEEGEERRGLWKHSSVHSELIHPGSHSHVVMMPSGSHMHISVQRCASVAFWVNGFTEPAKPQKDIKSALKHFIPSSVEVWHYWNWK